MNSIAIIVPVYNRPKRVADIVQKSLAHTYENKQIIVVVDGETNQSIEDALESYKEAIHIRYNNERLGKAESLNRAVAGLEADIILFLDNDILLPDDVDFLSKAVSAFDRCDILEFPKEAIVGSLISRMMRYEFMSYAIMEAIFANIAGRCPAMNGAAFAVRRELFEKLGGFRKVVNEDLDFAARAFRVHARVSYKPELKVFNEVPDTFRDWFRQRKRWALGNILWLKDNFRLLVRSFLKTPAFFLTLLLMLLPVFIIIAVFILLKQVHLTMILPFIFMLTDRFNILAGVFLWISHYHVIFTEGLIPSLIGFAGSGLVYFVFSRYLRFKFNPLEYALYYILYAPLWVTANLVMWVLVICKIDVRFDWKL